MWRVSSVVRLAGLSVPPPTTETVGQRSQWRGTAVHAFAESFAYGEVLKAHPDHEGYVMGVRNWFKEFQPIVLRTETRVVSKGKRLTGRIDLCARIEGWPTIIDYATGHMPPAKGIQVSGYVELANTNDEMLRLAAGRPWRRAVLELPGNGKYHWHGWETLDKNDPHFFRAALALVAWRFDHGVLTYIDPERPD